MLVLSRRQGESIILDHTITVTVVEIRGDQVRLCVEVPDGTRVIRQEYVGRVATSAGNGSALATE